MLSICSCIFRWSQDKNSHQFSCPKSARRMPSEYRKSSLLILSFRFESLQDLSIDIIRVCMFVCVYLQSMFSHPSRNTNPWAPGFIPEVRSFMSPAFALSLPHSYLFIPSSSKSNSSLMYFRLKKSFLLKNLDDNSDNNDNSNNNDNHASKKKYGHKCCINGFEFYDMHDTTMRSASLFSNVCIGFSSSFSVSSWLTSISFWTLVAANVHQNCNIDREKLQALNIEYPYNGSYRRLTKRGEKRAMLRKKGVAHTRDKIRNVQEKTSRKY